LIVDVSEVKLPSEAKQNNLPPECGQPIGVGEHMGAYMYVHGVFMIEYQMQLLEVQLKTATSTAILRILSC
jgi:hypothetical protein